MNFDPLKLRRNLQVQIVVIEKDKVKIDIVEEVCTQFVIVMYFAQ